MTKEQFADQFARLLAGGYVPPFGVEPRAMADEWFKRFADVDEDEFADVITAMQCTRTVRDFPTLGEVFQAVRAQRLAEHEKKNTAYWQSVIFPDAHNHERKH